MKLNAVTVVALIIFAEVMILTNVKVAGVVGTVFFASIVFVALIGTLIGLYVQKRRKNLRANGG